jgi:homopolymeric O-antigen transport system permease protein
MLRHAVLPGSARARADTMEYTVLTNLGQVVRNMLKGMRTSWFSGYRYFVQNLHSQYARSYLGLSWEILEPTAIALAFVLLRSSNVIEARGIAIPYALYIICGIMIYQTFQESLIRSVKSLETVGGISNQIRISPELVICSLLIGSFYNSVFKFAVVIVAAVYFGYFTWTGAVYFLISLPFVILMAAAIGFLLAPFNALANDVGLGVGVAMRPLMFLSAVIVPLPDTGLLHTLTYANPAAVVVMNLRSLLVQGSLTTPSEFFAWLAITVILALIAWYVFHVSFRYITARI